MDKQTASPKASQSNPAPATKADAAPATVKARVRPNGRYGKHRAGEIVDVDPRELIVCRHVLVALDAEHEEAEQVKAASASTKADTQLFRAARSAGRASADQMRESARVREIERLRSLGITIGGVSTK